MTIFWSEIGSGFREPKVRKMGNKKRATCLATSLQNELNSDVARFTTHDQTVNKFVARQVCCNIAMQHVLQ